MLRLILMRHAKSDWHGNLLDHDRPLNARGLRSAAALGMWLHREAYVPDEVLCSSARRTQDTLAGLSLPGSVTPHLLRSLYLAEADEMLGVLQQAKGACVLMLGHNHGIADMAQELVQHKPAHARFQDYPTGATLVAEFKADNWNDIGWHEGQPIAFVIPRELPEG